MQNMLIAEIHWKGHNHLSHTLTLLSVLKNNFEKERSSENQDKPFLATNDMRDFHVMILWGGERKKGREDGENEQFYSSDTTTGSGEWMKKRGKQKKKKVEEREKETNKQW